MTGTGEDPVPVCFLELNYSYIRLLEKRYLYGNTTVLTMTALELKAYEIFKNKLGEAEAGTLLQFIDEKAQEKVSAQKDGFASKDDFRKLEREDSRLEQTLKTETSRLEALIKTEVSRLETSVERGFKDQLKWLIVLLFGFASLIITVIKLL